MLSFLAAIVYGSFLDANVVFDWLSRPRSATPKWERRPHLFLSSRLGYGTEKHVTMGRATNFSELIDLLERSEQRLIDSGLGQSPVTRLQILRGIYYGTTWSNDYSTENSLVRNFGFTVFTGGFSSPADPREVLGSLFRDLQQSQDITDGAYKLDVGHALIGMEARTSYIGRSLVIPSQGGTGLEVVTWLGDLGGGAANLAWHRSRSSAAASRSVQTVFVAAGSSYGAPINLEGDIAAYIIGSTGPTLQDVQFRNNRVKIADLFRAYLPVSVPSRVTYAGRSRTFLRMIGGNFGSTSSRLSNRTAVKTFLQRRIVEFGAAYMTQRYVLEGQRSSRIQLACQHLNGAAEEVAETFLRALEYHISRPRGLIAARSPWVPASSPSGSCPSIILRSAVNATDIGVYLERKTRQERQELRDWINRLLE